MQSFYKNLGLLHTPAIVRNKAENKSNVVDLAEVIKSAKANNDGGVANKSKLEELTEKLQKAEDNLEKAIKTLNEKQAKVDQLKEKMKNTHSIFAKIGLGVAYAAATMGLKIAKLGVRSAEGYVMGLKKAIEALIK